MKKMIPIIVFYSYRGLDEDGREISFGNGNIAVDENIAADENINSILITKAKMNNPNVVMINILALTPLEFEVVEEFEENA